MREDFLVRLFAYRERPDKAPQEDFLTEVFCEFLQCLCNADLGDHVAELLTLDIRPGAGFTWATQQPIKGGRPDILGQGTCSSGKDLLVIIENKIWAGFTTSGEPGTDQGQLDRYQCHLDERADTANTRLILVTHGTRPPPGFTGVLKSWSEIATQLMNWLRQNTFERQPLLRALATWVAAYLKENNMAEISLDIATIGARSASNKLDEACQRLGLEAKNTLIDLLDAKLKNCGFSYPNRSLSGDRMAYFTCLIPNNAQNLSVNGACVVIWGGVKLGTFWGVANEIEDIPEFFMAISIWVPDHNGDELSNVSLLDKFIHEANLPASWTRQIDRDDRYDTVASIVRREVFTRKFDPSTNWVMLAKDFFGATFSDIRQIPDTAFEALNTWHGKIVQLEQDSEQ